MHRVDMKTFESAKKNFRTKVYPDTEPQNYVRISFIQYVFWSKINLTGQKLNSEGRKISENLCVTFKIQINKYKKSALLNYKAD